MPRGDARRRRSSLVVKHRDLKYGKHGWGAVVEDHQPKSATKKKPTADDGMTASMRKFLSLKSAASGIQKEKKSKNKFANGVPGKEPSKRMGSGVATAATGAASRAKIKEEKVIAKESHQEREGGGSEHFMSGQGMAHSAAQGLAAQTPPAKDDRKLRKKKEFKPAVVMERTGVREKRKAYLKARDERRKARQRKAKGSEVERLLESRAMTSAPTFGEQVAAPLAVQLKRKHWVDSGVGAEAPAGTKGPGPVDPFQKLARIPKAAAGILLDKADADKLQYDAIAGYRSMKKAKLAAQGREYDAFHTPASLVLLAQGAGK